MDKESAKKLANDVSEAMSKIASNENVDGVCMVTSGDLFVGAGPGEIAIRAMEIVESMSKMLIEFTIRELEHARSRSVMEDTLRELKEAQQKK